MPPLPHEWWKGLFWRRRREGGGSLGGNPPHPPGRPQMNTRCIFDTISCIMNLSSSLGGKIMRLTHCRSLSGRRWRLTNERQVLVVLTNKMPVLPGCRDDSTWSGPEAWSPQSPPAPALSPSLCCLWWVYYLKTGLWLVTMPASDWSLTWGHHHWPRDGHQGCAGSRASLILGNKVKKNGFSIVCLSVWLLGLNCNPHHFKLTAQPLKDLSSSESDHSQWHSH